MQKKKIRELEDRVIETETIAQKKEEKVEKKKEKRFRDLWDSKSLTQHQESQNEERDLNTKNI